jgi:outer membrane protein TolC
VEYEQRLFQPNELKNDLEEAELDLESSEMNFTEDVIELIDETSEQYLELFEDAYDQIIYQEYVDHLGEALELGEAIAANDPAREADLDQIRIELANAQESLQSAQSSYRLATAEMKQEFQLPQALEIFLEPEISISPVMIPTERAVELARTLTPRLRNLEINMREQEINLENTKAQNAFRLDLNFTYGREMQNEFLRDLFLEPSNSYSASVRAYVPIWDWGQRDYRIAAQEIGLEQNRLQMEQTTTDIESSVTNEVRNVEEFESRALNMQQNRVLAHDSSVASLERYENSAITASELLQSLEREVDTFQNALEAYLGWRDALLGIQRQTYYDFESDQPVLQRFGINTDDVGSDPLLEEEEEEEE